MIERVSKAINDAMLQHDDYDPTDQGWNVLRNLMRNKGASA